MNQSDKNESDTTILKVLVGSRAHGLAREDSDYDYRGVFVRPTTDILAVDAKPHDTNWLEGRKDNTSYEIGHFLHLALQCNPSAMELLVAPIVPETGAITQEGKNMRELLPSILDSEHVAASYCNYGHNQCAKLMSGKDGKPWKFATNWIRTLLNAKQLLETGTFNMQVPDGLIDGLVAIRDGKRSTGFGVDWAHYLEADVRHAATVHVYKQNVSTVNRFLLAVRKEHW